MKKVTVRGITPGYPIERAIEHMRWFTGKSRKEMFDDNKYEIRTTGAEIIDRIGDKGGDTIVFEISDENAEIYLNSILKGFNKRRVKVEEIKEVV